MGIAIAVVLQASDARADTPTPTRDVDLPIAGLRVALPDRAGATWSVSSRWDAERAEDTLTLTAGEGTTRYAITFGGRTARDCPLRDPFPIELDGETWIRSGADAGALCRTLPEARVEVRIAPAPSVLDEVALADHRPVLRALVRAARLRTVIPHPVPALPPPDAPLDEALALPVAGLVVARPADGMYWRVAPPSEERAFDALVRVVPVFPEVQVAVRRHALAEVPGCARLQRYLDDRGWSAGGAGLPGWEGPLTRWFGRFFATALCRVRDGALLDVRVAARPEVPVEAFDAVFGPLLAALSEARVVAPPPPSPVPDAPVRSVTLLTAALGLGVDLPGTIARGETLAGRSDGAAPYASVELGLAWMARNGPLLGATLTAGADGHGARLGATLEAGVALALDGEVTLGLALAFDDQSNALYANRSLSWVVDLRSNWHRPGAFAWSLRLVPLLLASREPAITGLPLAISWQGIVAGGLLVGVDLRWVSSPTRASEAWPSEGLGLGVRVGVGSLRH